MSTPHPAPASAYEPGAIEAAAHAHWTARDAHRVVEDTSRPKFYACSMLPYPSGKLHMGHVRNYTINDMMARYLRMKGYNVLMPMGWDAFGLPAENAAIDKKVAPAQWTRDNIADMKSQMQPLGLAFDWSREVATCDPDYYKWNQWFFLKLLEKGIAYKKTQVVNWDPVDQTVLANEQVIDGRGWRSGAPVERREIPGYYLAITQYADELLANVADPASPGFLHGWPERVRLMQEHWIGKSAGVRFAFPHEIRDADGTLVGDGLMHVFTTRADTIMGVTFCAVAPEHPLATHAAASDPDLAAFIETCKAGGTTEAELATKDKEGRPTGLFVKHPLSGAPVPVWVGNYVLMGYGDGAVMGVPAHDERDFAFAKKYGIDILQVVHVDGEHFSYDHWQDWYADKQRGVTINSGNLSGLSYPVAVDAVAAALAAQGLGDKKTTWRLRDWGISRQRYWGTPIPIIHCTGSGPGSDNPGCGDVPVPEQDLPVLLPEDLIPDGSGNPLNKSAAFLNVACPKCGAPAKRETDTMDTFVDSSWYYMRYCCPDSDAAMVDSRNDYWMPMDQYIGGIEHAVLHLLYARFWTKAMRDCGLVKFDEPFTKLFTQGMLLNESYYREDASGKKRWFYPSEVEVQFDDKGHPVGAIAREDGQPVQLGGIEKMSKSKNNVVEPRDIIAKFGADTARLFTMFAGPPDQSAAWSDSGAEGSFRYLRRLWAFATKQREAVQAAGTDFADASRAAIDLRRDVHLLLRQVSHDYDRLQYNTVVSGAMKLLNALESAALADTAADRAALREGLGILLRALYPAAPHIAHALWQDLGYAAAHGDLLDAPWPAVDEQALVQDEIELVLQVNGKLRGALKVPASADRAAIEAAALASPELAKFAEGRTPKKVVVVPGRLVNVVV
ncbi:leucine--tRNA ligase [Methylibium petroleiphilum]|uniref:Leucine--tRNA ligase n=1 Tax=Methylibium petroleiphilum (strain ATCC BAA-1232 / LMG 22953 / PM1) TaxID=420662 RepID=SYL_METPP|nr:leucine--tRNA ligase [Methylibium petroleiphilum]A2SC91.1 RecName: Full=Leucine--tRNA ligase; AltName: Full=Leucyl-tRNA synthetase; Short=LeuRS [Methylibium petroleiphilum PM1]ABM93180.1 leucyl-tRNA synthetase [Methylibium petroleiphilum PM1]